MKIAVNNKIISSGAVNTNGNTASFEKQYATEMRIQVIVRTKTGSPNAKFYIQSSPNKTDWTDITAALDVTNTGNFTLAATNFGKYVRIRWTISSGSLDDFDLWATYKNA